MHWQVYAMDVFGKSTVARFRETSAAILNDAVSRTWRYMKWLITEFTCMHSDDQVRISYLCMAWWRHQMDTSSALLAICAGNSPVPGEFPAQRPVTRVSDVFCDLCLNKRLSKQSWGWWFEAPSRSLWRHRNGNHILRVGNSHTQ